MKKRAPLRSRVSKSPPVECPACGAEVPRTARACPECGADDQAGWNEEQARYDGLDLPEAEFDYDEFCRREFGSGASSGSGPRRWGLTILVGLLCLGLLFLWGLVR